MNVDLNTLNHKLKELYTAYYTPEEQQAIDVLIDAVKTTFDVSIGMLGEKNQYESVRDAIAACTKLFI